MLSLDVVGQELPTYVDGERKRVTVVSVLPENGETVISLRQLHGCR